MDALLLTTADDVATITFNRPDKGNAIGLAALDEAGRMLSDLATSSIRALVITGAGDRVFSAGMDLSDVSVPGAWDENPLTAFCEQLQCFPRPTIARINGAVIGGATEVALSCDLRVGVDTTRLRVPAIDLGVHYEHAGLARAIAQLGVAATRRIYMLGDKLDAAAMAEIGFLDCIVPVADLDSTIAGILDQIRAGAPLAVDGVKQSIVELMNGADGSAASARIAAAWKSDDLQEGLAAVRDKRKPIFKGR